MTIEEQAVLLAETVESRLDLAEQYLGFPFPGMRDAIAKFGAVKAAKFFVGPQSSGKLHDGLKALARVDKLIWSIEQAVVDFEQSKLFTAEEVSAAKARLIMARRGVEKKND